MKSVKVKIANKRMNVLRDILNFLEAAKKGLHSTILSVSINNGSNWAESSAAMLRSTERIKDILPLSFPDRNNPQRNTITVRKDENNSFENIGLEKSSTFLSIAESLRLSSFQEISALSLVAPIIIATDSFLNPTTLSPLISKNNLSQENSTSSLHNNLVKLGALPGRNRPILDVARIKLGCFKNAISAIKMFLSAPVIVTNS